MFKKKGKPPPESATPPEVPAWDTFYLTAFLDLQHDKTAMRSIPWLAVHEYGKRCEMTHGEFEMFKENIFGINRGLEAALETRNLKAVEIAKQKHENKSTQFRKTMSGRR